MRHGFPVLGLAALAVVGMVGGIINLAIISNVEVWNPVATRSCSIKSWERSQDGIFAYAECGPEQIEVRNRTLLIDVLNKHVTTITCTRMLSSIRAHTDDQCEL